MLVHATCVSITEQGVLIAGPPGSGKSDLALRLIDSGATLVADDQTVLTIADDRLTASAPDTLAGLIEIRQLGIVRMPYRAAVPVALYVELVTADGAAARMPDDDPVFLLDRAVRRLRLQSFAASTPAKIRAALAFPLSRET